MRPLLLALVLLGSPGCFTYLAVEELHRPTRRSRPCDVEAVEASDGRILVRADYLGAEPRTFVLEGPLARRLPGDPPLPDDAAPLPMLQEGAGRWPAGAALVRLRDGRWMVRRRGWPAEAHDLEQEVAVPGWFHLRDVVILPLTAGLDVVTAPAQALAALWLWVAFRAKYG